MLFVSNGFSSNSFKFLFGLYILDLYLWILGILLLFEISDFWLNFIFNKSHDYFKEDVVFYLLSLFLAFFNRHFLEELLIDKFFSDITCFFEVLILLLSDNSSNTILSKKKSSSYVSSSYDIILLSKIYYGLSYMGTYVYLLLSTELEDFLS